MSKDKKPAVEKILRGYVNDRVEESEFEKERKPNGYWRDFENVRTAIIEVAIKMGHFPTREELTDNGYSTLSAIISKYHGGSEAVKKRMKIPKVLRKSKKMLEIEERIGEPIEVYLKREYLDNRRSAMNIGEELQLSWVSVGHWLDKFKIDKRTLSEQLLNPGIKKAPKKTTRKDVC